MMDSVRTPAPPRLPWKHALLSMLGIWLCYFLLTTLRGTIFGSELQLELVWRRAIVCLVGVGFTGLLLLLIWSLRRSVATVQVVIGLLVALPASLGIAYANERMFAPVQGRAVEKIGEAQGVQLRLDEAGNLLLDLPSEEEGDVEVAGRTITIVEAPKGNARWQQLVAASLGPYFVLLAWLAIYFALLAGVRARTAKRQAGEFREAARTAELRSLRYQVNPHFLFNTLNSLSALVMTGRGERAEKMIQTISNFYRHSLSEEPTGDVELADEIDLQRHYLEIESVRFPKRLRTEFDLPQELEEERVPGMILQPLVENAVKYGVAPSTSPVTIRISAYRDGDDLLLKVADTGASEAGLPGSNGFGIGLANVRDRLQARFGKDASLTAGPDGERGWTSIIRIPGGRNG